MRGKIAMPVIAALLVLGVIGSSALAQAPSGLESYDAGADGVAFNLQVGLLDLQVAAGLTAAGVTSDGPAAVGDAVGLLLAGEEQTGAHAAAPDGEASAEDCVAEIELPAPLDLTDGTCIAGVASTAIVDGGAPAGTAESDSITIAIGGAELTEQVLGALPIEDLTTTLGGALDQLSAALCDPVGGILDQLPDSLPIPGFEDVDLTQLATVVCSLGDAATIVDNLLNSLASAVSTTLTVTVAPNSSAASADSVDGVIASAIAEGATIGLLPGLGPDGTAFLEVVVGRSEASVVRDATTGEGTPVATPAVADVTVNGIDVGGAVADLGLDLLLGPIVDGVNNLVNMLATQSPLACGEAGPLADIICLDAAAGFILDAEGAAAEGYDFGAGTVGARTSALRLEVLRALNGGEPAVSLSLAEAVAAANAVPATPVTPTTAPPTSQLPRTGPSTSSDFAPLVLAFGLGAGALVIRMRRHATR